jgi:hypothetical protein
VARLAAVASVRRLLSVLMLIAALGAVPATAGARVPQGFVGMMVDGPLFDSHLNLGRQLDTMVSSGVETLRIVFNWAAAEPYARWADVPVGRRGRFTNIGGRPIDFTTTDRLVGLAAQRGLTIMPVVLFTPGWAAAGGTPPGGYSLPASDNAYARFAAALARRYGPHGTYWRSHPRTPAVPIRLWQIWNEPNLAPYWSRTPAASTYVALVRAAHDAIKQTDPSAKIVLAGMPNDSWNFVSQIYRVPGARHVFDVVAVNPFTKRPAGVITILGYVRAAMDRAGDTRKPIIASEISFPSAVGKSSQHFGFETTEAGQARDLAALLPLLAARRHRLHLLGFYHFSWAGREHRHDSSFSFAGLFRWVHFRLVVKPAYPAFRSAALAMEGCKVKAAIATRCRRR